MISSHHLLKEPLYRRNIALRALQKFDCVPFFVQSMVQMFPLSADLHVSFINVVGSAGEEAGTGNANGDTLKAGPERGDNSS
jgi:hypothetical protein